ncbi:uncharacterized protein LOC125531460 isoform X1 [Triticum urartu]|uniref:uncharacterized protein LOC125531460 isoform X1 n=1 Tax=Triticum urartu TaxID=4572 RepID=UPI002044259B|nr:uncharacterized protein LOC125531460 isoform X1 [Triticum urartu]
MRWRGRPTAPPGSEDEPIVLAARVAGVHAGADQEDFVCSRRSRWCTRQPVAMEEDEIHEEGFLEISQHLQMLQQGEEKFCDEQYEKAAAGGGGFEGGFENPIEDIFGSLMTV